MLQTSPTHNRGTCNTGRKIFDRTGRLTASVASGHHVCSATVAAALPHTYTVEIHTPVPRGRQAGRRKGTTQSVHTCAGGREVVGHAPCHMAKQLSHAVPGVQGVNSRSQVSTALTLTPQRSLHSMTIDPPTPDQVFHDDRCHLRTAKHTNLPTASATTSHARSGWSASGGLRGARAGLGGGGGGYRARGARRGNGAAPG